MIPDSSDLKRRALESNARAEKVENRREILDTRNQKLRNLEHADKVDVHRGSALQY